MRLASLSIQVREYIIPEYIDEHKIIGSLMAMAVAAAAERLKIRSRVNSNSDRMSKCIVNREINYETLYTNIITKFVKRVHPIE